MKKKTVTLSNESYTLSYSVEDGKVKVESLMNAGGTDCKDDTVLKEELDKAVSEIDPEAEGE